MNSFYFTGQFTCGYSSWPLPSDQVEWWLTGSRVLQLDDLFKTKQKLQRYLEQVQNRSYIHTEPFRYQEAKTVSYHCGIVVHYINKHTIMVVSETNIHASYHTQESIYRILCGHLADAYKLGFSVIATCTIWNLTCLHSSTVVLSRCYTTNPCYWSCVKRLYREWSNMAWFYITRYWVWFYSLQLLLSTVTTNRKSFLELNSKTPTHTSSFGTLIYWVCMK